MITIKHDENLAALANITKTGEQIIAQSIIDTIDPFALDETVLEWSLGEFIDEVGYYVEDFIDKLHSHASIPVSVLDSSITDLIRKLRFWYEGSEHPCKNCGYEVMWINDDIAGHPVQGTCPMCHRPAIMED